MEARIERRAPEVPRIPLDVLVRLTHEDFEDPFDADGVDVSAGGLALRADYLPEVGDRLRCRFDCPPDGSEVEVDGEVVWAHDAGERSGEFGLRFTALDEHAERALDGLLAQVGERRHERPTARLHLEAVATPIDAEIVARGPGSITVEQELPFLRLGMGVVVEGSGPAHGRLSAVGLRVEGGVPRLVLSVRDARESVDPGSFDGGRVDGGRIDGGRIDGGRIDAGQVGHDEPLEDAYAGSSEGSQLDDEAPAWAAEDGADAAHQAAYEGADDASGEWQPGELDSEPDATLQDYELPATLRASDESAAESTGEGTAPTTGQARAGARIGDEQVASPRSSHHFELAEEPQARPAWLERLVPALSRVKEGCGGVLAKARPVAVALWAKLALFAAGALEKAGPGAKRLVVRLRALGGAIGAKVSARLARVKKAKRRTTSAPVRAATQAPRLRRQRGEEPAPPPPARKNRRALALSALAFVTVGGVVYGLTRGEAPAPVEEPAVVAPPPAPLEALEMPSAPAVPASDVLAAPEPATAPPAPAAAAPPAPAPAASDGRPEIQAGRLDEPSYPSLREAVNRPPSGSQTFGAAEVPNGRSTTLRMSQPVAGLRGERQPDGFTVTIPGALSLDRAGPIAAANPSVDQAMVLNRGDHAVLTVRFVAGRTPPYRVVARGEAIEVTIGR